MTERFLVTGANGCIGAWVLKHLSQEGADVVAFDLREDDHRHRLINDGNVPEVDWVFGDLTNSEDVKRAADGVTHIVHLAALQVPFCRANPIQGAAVNVTGTVNVFEAARQHGVKQIAQASSIAVFGSTSDYADRIIPEDAPLLPTTLYGVYKVATEDLAKVYWNENKVRSIGLRPHTVFGPGRDQGMTSLPSVGIEKAIRREAFHIEYGGTLDFQYASDVATAFIHAARFTVDGAPTYNLSCHSVAVSEFARITGEITGFDGITCGVSSLPVVEGAKATSWYTNARGPQPTPLRDAIEQSVRIFSASS